MKQMRGVLLGILLASMLTVSACADVIWGNPLRGTVPGGFEAIILMLVVVVGFFVWLIAWLRKKR